MNPAAGDRGSGNARVRPVLFGGPYRSICDPGGGSVAFLVRPPGRVASPELPGRSTPVHKFYNSPARVTGYRKDRSQPALPDECPPGQEIARVRNS